MVCPAGAAAPTEEAIEAAEREATLQQEKAREAANDQRADMARQEQQDMELMVARYPGAGDDACCFANDSPNLCFGFRV